MRKDKKTILRGHRKRAILALSLALMLSGCGQLPSFLARGQQEQFHPLENNEVAVAAAPIAPQAVPNLLCRVGRGNAHFGKKWYDYVDAEFALAPNSRVTVPVARAKGSEAVNILGIFDADGQKLIFCPVVEGPPGKRVACFSLYVLEDDLAMGIKRTFDVPNAIRGGEITCAYDREKLQKL